jgi:hypothetical protein
MVTTRHRKKKEDDEEAKDKKEDEEKTKIGHSKQQKRKFEDTDENVLIHRKMKNNGPRKPPPAVSGKEEEEEEEEEEEDEEEETKIKPPKAQKKKSAESKSSAIAKKRKAVDKALSQKTTKDIGPTKLPPAIRESIDLGLAAGYADMDCRDAEDPVGDTRPKQRWPKLPTSSGGLIRAPTAAQGSVGMYTDNHRRAQKKFQRKAKEERRLVSILSL